jgi:hypothetical protein
MRDERQLIGALSVAVLTMLSAAVAAQETPEMSEEAAAAMAAWTELATPGEHQEHLARYAGRWQSEVKMWMEPGGEPMVSPAMSEARMILGGRYLEWEHSAVFGGLPFEGKGLDAYNNGEDRYESTWIDNFGTLIIFYTGQCGDGGKTRTLNGEFFDPVSGGKISQRAVYTWIDDDTFLYESFMAQDGAEFKNMEIRYTRVD